LSQFDELPEGWVLVIISDIADVTKLAGFEFTNYFNYQEVGEVKVVRGLNVGDGFFKPENFKFIDLKTSLDLPRSQLKAGDLLITYVGTPGKVALLPSDGARYHLGPNVGKIVISNRINDARYLMHFIRSPLGKNSIQVTSKAVTQSSLSMKQIRSIPLPLPPLNEQRRIVEKIEALTARSRKAREALETIPELLDQFRQSVLAAAFRGDLTADWREQNPDVEPDWKLLSLSEAIHGKPRNGYSPKSVDYPTAIKSLSLSATTSGIFQSQHFKYIDEVIADDSHLWLTPGDILIQRSNTIEYVGTSAIYDGEPKEFIYPDLMMKIQVVREKAIPEFIHICLSAEQVRRYFKSKATGTAGNMPKINQKTVLDTPIPMPSIAEQKEVIKQVHQYLYILEKVRVEYEELIIDAEQLELFLKYRGIDVLV
jgi:type I restriction enzyme S subunit